jgi:hypothetical protein
MDGRPIPRLVPPAIHALATAPPVVATQALDGLVFADRLIERFGRSGEPWAVGFDIDDTLVDTRARTLAALRAFASSPAGHVMPALPLAKLVPEDMQRDGAATAADLASGNAAFATSFQKFWERFFWTPASLRHDRPIERIMAMARKVAASGGEVFYITGRNDLLATETFLQLRTYRLPNVDPAHVFHKPYIPGRRIDTPGYKVTTLEHIGRRGISLAAFVTECRRDLASIVAMRRAPIPIFIDWPTEPLTQALAPGTPVIGYRALGLA